jgi:hypothetical protein
MFALLFFLFRSFLPTLNSPFLISATSFVPLAHEERPRAFERAEMNIGSKATFSDNPGNRRLNRVGKPIDSVCMAATMANISFGFPKSEVYVDNTCNLFFNRASKPVGTCRKEDFGQKVALVLKKLWTNPGYDFENVDSDVAETAADIYARQDTESTYGVNYFCSSSK